MQLLQCKALADATRLRLLHLLQRNEFSVNELMHILKMGQSRVSRHLKILTEARLLQFRRDGLWIFYTIPREGHYREFIAEFLHYLEVTPEMQADLKEAQGVLEERVRKSQQFFDSIAGKWDDLNREILGDFDLPTRVISAMPKQCECMADLGCGTGSVLIAIANHAKKCIGVDSSQSMLECCKSRIHQGDCSEAQFSLRIGELTHLPLRDHEVSFASVNLVLHHLSDPEAALLEIYRCLEPNGRLFIADFMQHNDETMRIRYGDLRLGFSVEEIQGYLQRTGFTVIDIKRQDVLRGLTLLLIQAER